MRTRRGLIRWIRKKLLRQLEEVSGRWRESTQDEQILLDSREIDHGDLNVQQQLAGQLDALSEVERAEIVGILDALARIDAGAYGSCTGCGEFIGDARLVAYPLAVLCVDCAEVDEGPRKQRAMKGGALGLRAGTQPLELPDLSSDDPEEPEGPLDSRLTLDPFAQRAGAD